MADHTRRRWFWLAGAVLVLAAVAFTLAPKPVPSDYVEVVRGPMQVSLDHEGKTRVHDRFAITAPFAGRIARIELEPGDTVVAGETVLATLWPNASALLDPTRHAEAAAAVRADRARLKAAAAERDRASASHELAVSELRRSQGLVASGVLSELEAERASTLATRSAAELEAAESAVATARFQLEASEARLRAGTSGFDPRDQAGVEIRSPIDGVVLRRAHQSEVAVAAGELLLEVGDPSDLEVVADYLSNDAVKITSGMPTVIVQWGGGAEIAGRVRRVDPAGFLKVSALGVEEQRVNVVVDLETPYEAWKALGDEYRVEVKVVTWRADDVLIVPTNALFRHQGGWAVFVADAGTARLRPVEIGQRNSIQAEVLDGLAAGEIVLAHPSEAVEDGVSVASRTG